MKKLLLATVLAASLAPLAARASSDRLNLWPLLSVDDGACDIIWPIGHFESTDSWRIFPVIRNHDLFGVFPELWFRDNGFAVLPFATRYDLRQGFVFPVAWWDFDGSQCFHSLFPLYWYSSDSYNGKNEKRLFWAAGGLAGWSQRHGKTEASWLFPLYIHNKDNFYSLPYSRSRDGEKKTTALCGGLGGWTTQKDETINSWLLPFFYQDERRFITPLFGMSDDAHWLLPFYYKDNETLGTPLFWSETKGDKRNLSSLLLLSGAQWDTKGTDYEWLALAGLAGATRRGARTESWLIPFYVDRPKRFVTALYGTNKRDWRYWLTPLVGTYFGEKTGGWLFPLFNCEKDKRFDEYESLLNLDVLPEKYRKNKFRLAKVRGSLGVLSDFDRSVSLSTQTVGSLAAETNKAAQIDLNSRTKRGNKMFFNREEHSWIHFDKETGARLDESRRSESCAVGGLLYEHESWSDSAKGTADSKTSVLWRFWRREEHNGNVTIDAFPGFTHDSRTNGFTKTSFLWRFFRYEHNPDTGTTLDLLFIPILRP